MNIVIGSAFRNSPHEQVSRWCRQVHDLRAAMSGHSVRCVAVEGDSTNDTADDLLRTAHEYSLDLSLVHCHHGGPVFGSTESPERMACLSRVGNAIFDAVRETDDVLVYVESDLIWTPETIMRLIGHLGDIDAPDVVAPLVFAGDNFYDVYVFRGLDGERFAPFFPYHSSLISSGKTEPPYTWSDIWFTGEGIDTMPVRVKEVSSVGSCLVMRGRVARTARIRNDQALIGWCEDARRLGYRIAVAPGLTVEHPV
jgi:hypothetical protein